MKFKLILGIFLSMLAIEFTYAQTTTNISVDVWNTAKLYNGLVCEPDYLSQCMKIDTMNTYSNAEISLFKI